MHKDNVFFLQERKKRIGIGTAGRNYKIVGSHDMKFYL